MSGTELTVDIGRLRDALGGEMGECDRRILVDRLWPRGVSHDELDEAAVEVARAIAAKDTRVIRKAKEAINGIDPVNVHTSYRFEQGFTFELNLAGYSDEHRREFVSTGRTVNEAAEAQDAQQENA